MSNLSDSSVHEDDVDARVLPLGVACVLLGAAVWAENGLYARGAVALLLLALGALAHAALLRGKVPAEVGRVALGAGVVVQGVLLLMAPPLNDLAGPTHVWVHYAAWGATVVAGVGVACVQRVTRGSGALLLALMLAGAGVGGAWAIVQNTGPRVDVFVYQQHASAALLQGINPYTLTFPNPYTPEESWVFAPGTASGGRILFGFPYLPGTLLLALPAHAIFGDYRVGQLLAVLGAAALIARAGGYSRVSLLGAALVLTWPRLPWVIEWGWSEPTVTLLLVWALTPHRHRLTSAVATALLLASKQYVPLTAAALLDRLLSRPRPASPATSDSRVSASRPSSESAVAPVSGSPPAPAPPAPAMSAWRVSASPSASESAVAPVSGSPPAPAPPAPAASVAHVSANPPSGAVTDAATSVAEVAARRPDLRTARPTLEAPGTVPPPPPVAPGRSTPLIPLLAVALATAVTLPLALWDFGAFWRSAVTLQLAQPFRPDALSLTSLVYDLTGYRLPELTGVLLCVAASILLTARRVPVAWTVAICLTLLFVLSKQAFANYYLLLGTSWAVLLTTPVKDPGIAMPRPSQPPRPPTKAPTTPPTAAPTTPPA